MKSPSTRVIQWSCGATLVVLTSFLGAGGCGSNIETTSASSSSSSSSGSGGSSSSSSSSSTSSSASGGIDCQLAQNGQPCSNIGENCSFGDACAACNATCLEPGVWDISCSTLGACPDAPPPTGSPCEPLCQENCTFTIDTSCGAMQAEASCGLVGWRYDFPCPTDCSAHATAGECATDFNCYWAAPCEGSDVLGPQCLPAKNCESSSDCPMGKTCKSLIVNPCNLGSGECGGCGALAKVCLP